MKNENETGGPSHRHFIEYDRYELCFFFLNHSQQESFTFCLKVINEKQEQRSH